MTALLCSLAFVALFVAQPPATPDDAAVWNHYEAWVARLEVLKPGEKKSMADRYVEQLVSEGVPKAEATRRYRRVTVIRRESSAKEMIYWNGAFKSGGGPDAPLQLLQETVRHLKPGKALEPGMGRGRNAIWLAGLGWDVTGYDIAQDALKVAHTDAARAGVRITTSEGNHDTYDFGVNQWNLILCAYCYMQIDDARWPAAFAKALEPGGVVVFQTSLANRRSVADLAALWKDFQILRVEDLDAGMEMSDWTPSRTLPTARLVARKR
jgi:2-polyprenyl-3-methyl-5-hydroxy-6-metoxy-1,4-benzoquinol methylase